LFSSLNLAEVRGLETDPSCGLSQRVPAGFPSE